MQALLPYIEINPEKKPMASVIWLHGLGADGHDFENIVPELKLPKNLHVRFIFPHAPIRPVTLNGGFMMRAWFDIKEVGSSIDLNPQEDEEGICEAEELIRNLIQHENSLGIPYHRIILAGFSQGGALALHTGLHYPEKLGGILSLSGYLPLSNQLKQHEIDPDSPSIPIMIAHGDMDAIIPFSISELTLKCLEHNGYEVEFHAYPMEHTLCYEEIEDISKWLQRVILSS